MRWTENSERIETEAHLHRGWTVASVVTFITSAGGGHHGALPRSSVYAPVMFRIGAGRGQERALQ